MSEADELFDGGQAPRPRGAWVWTFVISGLVLAIFGLGCTALPGTALVLVGWYLAWKDSDRVESGYLALAYGPSVSNTLWFSGVVMVGVLGLLCAQLLLLSETPAYDMLVKVLARAVIEARFGSSP